MNGIPKYRRQGFTLVELLTVIAIVGILAAIIIPVVGAARKSARSAECSSNLRQIMAGLQLYVADNKGLLPAASALSDPNDPESSTSKWSRDLNAYLPLSKRAVTTTLSWDHEIFVCPSAETKDGKSGPSYIRMAYNCTEALYGINENGPGGVSRFTARRYNSIENPSSTMLVHDAKLGGADNPNVQSNYAANWSQASADTLRSPDDMIYFSFRHKDAMNILMADGSIQSVRPDWVTHLTANRWRGLE